MVMTAPVDVVDRHPATVVEVASDGCDRCGPHVKAFVFAKLRTGSLAYCAHCGTRFWKNLTAQAITVIDQRHLVDA